jgi:gas vesicle protein
MVVIEQGGGLLWLLVGGAIGAGLGLLLAPHSGRKTRRLLSERLQKLKDSAEAALDDLGEEDDEELPEEEPGDTAPALGGDEGSEEESEDEEPKRPTGSARAELERRLAQARARRQRVYVDEDEEPVA